MRLNKNLWFQCERTFSSFNTFGKCCMLEMIHFTNVLCVAPANRFVVSCIPSWFWGPMVTLEDCLAAFFAADELKGTEI